MKAFLLTERFREETKCEFIAYHTEKEIDNTCTAHKSEIPVSVSNYPRGKCCGSRRAAPHNTVYIYNQCCF